ncbi:MAG: c-type cytochrome [Alphaproteobacteria bacterium]
MRVNAILWGTFCLTLALSARTASAQNNVAAGKALFKSNCAPCHGGSGKGDGPGGQALPVKPAHLGERIATNRYSDQYLIDMISKGGNSVGKSNFMPAWSGALTDRQIRDIVSFLRTLPSPASEKK